MERMVLCAGLCSSTLRVTVTLRPRICCFTAGLPFGKEALIPLLHQLRLWEAEVLFDHLSVQIPELPCAAGSAFSYTHISPLAQAAVPNCSGSQPTLSPFWFQVLMTVTSYFQPECFPTHGTANVQADLRSSFFFLRFLGSLFFKR